MTSVIVDDPPEFEGDEFVGAVWCLIFNMIEAGETGLDENGNRKWWGEEFFSVRRQLKERGFNLDPDKFD